MKNTQLIIGLLLLIASTATRVYLVCQTRNDIPTRPRFSLLPHARNEAFIFSFQLAGLLEIIVASLYGKLHFDYYLKLPIIGVLVFQVLFFSPIIIGFTLSAITVKVKGIT